LGNPQRRGAALLSALLTTIPGGFMMIAEHFRNGDGSPPITAFTADDSYLDKESRREDDPEKIHTTA
jgi:hypothetical protein